MADLPDFMAKLLASEGVTVIGGDIDSGSGRRNHDGSNKMPLMEQIKVLREAQDRYVSENFFKVGDLVSPREGFNMRGAGEVHIVVEKIAKEDAHYAFNVQETAGSSGLGRRLDMRVFTIMGDEVTSFWVESHTYEFHPLQRQGDEE